MAGRRGAGTVIDVGGEDAELLIDAGATTLRAGYFGIRTHQKLKIPATGGALIFEYGHDPAFPHFAAI